MYSSMALKSGRSVHIWTPTAESGGQDPRDSHRIAATGLNELINNKNDKIHNTHNSKKNKSIKQNHLCSFLTLICFKFTTILGLYSIMQ